jgi:acyl-coenzyme A thioesterase PaaI-like protein
MEGSDTRAIRARVLRGIALNRTPGYHFPVHFLDLSFDRVTREGALLSIETGPHCLDATGEAHLGAVALLVDLAMSATIRANLTREQRLGTVTMSLHLTGRASGARLEAESVYAGDTAGTAGRQGTGHYVLRSDGVPIGFGGGGFMVLRPPADVTMHPVTLRRRGDPDPAPIDVATLAAHERDTLARADAALAAGTSFIDHLWGARYAGARAEMDNASHTGNRVGHMQGGLLFAFGANAAQAALAASGGAWRLTAATAAFVSPGEGTPLVATSEIVHRGGLTAVVRSAVWRPDGKLALDVAAHFAAADSKGK